jgi:hypothetical protein
MKDGRRRGDEGKAVCWFICPLCKEERSTPIDQHDLGWWVNQFYDFREKHHLCSTNKVKR